MKYPKMVVLWDIPINDLDGNYIGQLQMTREITAQEEMDMRGMRKLFRDTINSCEESFRTPVID
jgi:hypothetical protein